jgi:hypothetical protein
VTATSKEIYYRAHLRLRLSTTDPLMLLPAALLLHNSDL